MAENLPGTDPHPIDEGRLAAYLESALPGFSGPLRAEKFSGGQSNPTYRLRAASGDYVLRRKPPGTLLKSAHAVDREFRVMGALHGTSVPVAQPYHLCTDDAVVGSMFYLMEYVPGRVFWDPALPGIEPRERAAIYDAMNAVLAALHGIEVEAAGLGDYGRPGSYFERQFARWSKQYQASRTDPIAAMDTLGSWLAAHLPPDDGRVSLVHGDFRLDNLIFHSSEPRVLAVVDWELSTLGHPLADLGYQCMQWRMPHDGALRGLAGVDRAALGIPGEAEYVAAYCRRTGLAGIEDWSFYLAFSCFRFAAILQGVLKRALDGNASSPRALEVGRMARPLAELALDIIEHEG